MAGREAPITKFSRLFRNKTNTNINEPDSEPRHELKRTGEQVDAN